MEDQSKYLQCGFKKKLVHTQVKKVLADCQAGAFTFLLKNYPQLINEIFSNEERLTKSILRQSGSYMSVSHLKSLLHQILESSVNERDFCCRTSLLLF